MTRVERIVIIIRLYVVYMRVLDGEIWEIYIYICYLQDNNVQPNNQYNHLQLHCQLHLNMFQPHMDYYTVNDYLTDKNTPPHTPHLPQLLRRYNTTPQGSLCTHWLE